MTHETEAGARSVNPATGALLAEWPWHSEAETERRLEGVSAAAVSWRRVPMAERAARLRALADGLEAEAEVLAQTLTAEMGKVLAESRAEVAKCVWVCRHYAEHGADLLAPTPVQAAARESWVSYEPLGVVLAIMPWNFPYWQVLRFAAPALMAGNVLLMKHAPNTQGCAEHVARIARESGLPAGCLELARVPVSGPGSANVAALIADRRVAAVTVTGSDRAGRAVAALAGQHLKKCVLELGGSDPFVVLADADLDLAVANAVKARCLNAGQTCCAAKRFVVERPVADAFVARFTAAMAALRVGDPTDPVTDLGGLARGDLVDQLDAQVQATLAAGARVATGGTRLDPACGAQHAYAPTVLVDVPAESVAAREELFGPVAAVFVADDVAHALALANDTDYGLAASLWTEDRERAKALVPQLHAGAVFVNRMPGSDPRLPFGGVKASGYGRELGTAGIRELVNVKTVCLD